MPTIVERKTALPDQTTASAFTALVNDLTEILQINLAALMTEDSPEPVHKARVALRRLRACLTAFEPIIDGDLAEAMQHRARALFRILGDIRDADVMAIRFADTDRTAAFESEATRQRQKMRKHLKRKKAETFRPWMLRRLAGKSWRRSGKKAKALREAPLTDLAIMSLDRAWAACLSNGLDLRVMSARAQHELRKDLKTFRYLTEFFADLWPGKAQKDFLRALRSMQDDLGELTDSALAQSLGHIDKAETNTPEEQTAKAWEVLAAQGPWWHPVQGSA